MIPEQAFPEPPGSSANATSFHAACNCHIQWTKKVPGYKNDWSSRVRRSVCFSDELASVGWRFAGVLVLEIGVYIHALAKPCVEAFPPSRDLLRSVIFEAQAGISEMGSEHLWRCLFVGLGQAKRRLILAKNGVCFVGVPGWVTYLEGERESFRAKGKKVFQQWTIELERGRCE